MSKKYQDFLAMQESETVEFKERWDDSTALKALSAFGNTRGGVFVVGMTDSRQLAGWKVSDRELEQIVSKISDVLRAHPTVVERIRATDEAELLVVKMPAISIPIPYQGRYYRRIGNSTREIMPVDLGRFLLERLGTTWDGLASDYGIEALDPAAIETFIGFARERLPLISSGEGWVSILDKLQLMEDGKILRAALLLFAKNPQKIFPNARVRIGRFKDAVTMLDDKMVEGSLWQQVDGTMKQLMQYIQVRYEFSKDASISSGIENMRRREVWDYPIDALREAVMNALVHRDYMSMENIHIRVFDDRITITNPGGLPEGLTLDDLRKDEHPSVPRNPLMAQVVYYANLIEKWGTGITRIRQAFAEQGLVEPELMANDARFTINLYKRAIKENAILNIQLTEQQKKAIAFVKEHGKITNKQCCEIAGYSDETARRMLKDLVQKDIFKMQGKGRNVHYILCEVGD